MGLLLSKEPRRRPRQKRPRCGSWWRRRRRPLLRWPRGAPAKAAAAPRGRDCLFRGPCMLCLVVHGPGAPAPAGPEEEPPLSSPRPLGAYGAPAEAGGDAVRAGGAAPSVARQPQHECGDADCPEGPDPPCDCHREPPPDAPDINQLPPSILLKIFSNLSLDERCLSASLVCKYWRDLCLDFQFWKQLDLSSRQQVTDELLEKIASRSQNIIEINISDCRSMSDTGVCVLAFKCPGLLRYTAYRCKQLSDTSIIAVASHCPLLQKVHVGNQDKLTDEGLKQLGSKCRELKDIHFGQCYKISDEGMIVIAKGCLKLQRIYMQENKLVTDQSVKAFAEHCPELQCVGFMGCSVTSKGVIHLTKLRNLSSLDLRHITELDNETVMEIVKRCKNLSSLNLCLNWIINDRCVEVIAKEGQNLKELYLVSCKITDYALVAIGRYSMTIETVDVGWCKEITDQGATLIAQSSKSLRYLGLMRCDKVSEVTVEQLVQQYPHITFSTVLQDCKRTLERAYQLGWTPGVSAASS
ncbi:F-box/LRR-repeat protein 17 [Oryx dammah]|uniref:F-box/LRR-repeat protein 17 n=1 Tax=Oryx dammah TaxID=59534 RepID=UPI001A9C1FA2|nr:F-box/LRR-repeat protein 17 [Oryx dammah]